MEEALTSRNIEKQIKNLPVPKEYSKATALPDVKMKHGRLEGPSSSSIPNYFTSQEGNLYPLNLSPHTGLLLSLEGTKRSQIESRVPKGPCGSFQVRKKKS